MNINRNNYEEYFLLYADKELSAEEKSMVEIFVEENADLEEEFMMIQHSVIKADNLIKLNDKSLLFRKEEFINQSNYEEKFLFYADNELNLSEIEETEKFVVSNPSLQNEFTLLQQVNYQPDTSIIFPDKRLLYKKEKSVIVIPFRWKALAAACLLGLGVWTGISYLQKKSVEPAIADKQIVIPKVKNVVKPIDIKDPSQKKDFVKTDDEKPNNPKVIQTEPDKPVNKLFQSPQKNIAKNDKPFENKPELKSIEKPKEEVTVIDLPVKKTNELPQPLNTETHIIDNKVTTAPSLANNNNTQPASYITEAEVKSENYVFYNITSEEFKKSKVGNFLKKVKRVVERQIPFKNNKFKIGTAEIAKDEQN